MKIKTPIQKEKTFLNLKKTFIRTKEKITQKKRGKDLKNINFANIHIIHDYNLAFQQNK